jgi:hypothetical protein
LSIVLAQGTGFSLGHHSFQQSIQKLRLIAKQTDEAVTVRLAHWKHEDANARARRKINRLLQLDSVALNGSEVCHPRRLTHRIPHTELKAWEAEN